VPIGTDPELYARDIIGRLRSKGDLPQTYAIECQPAPANEKTNTVEEISQPILGISRQLQHSTVRLECLKANGAVSSGTGFHFRLKIDDTNWVPAIITNKHVVAGSVECAIHLSLADEKGALSGQHERYILRPFQWIDHPSADVDLVLIPIQPLLAQLGAVGKRPFYIDLDEAIIPNAETLAKLNPLEEILMVGYPNGIWDTVNNFPIFRRGITATSCNLNYQGRSEFLVDAAVFPGSSGSPVFIYNEGSYLSGNTIIFGGRLLFIGVLYAVHLHTATGEIKTITIPTDTKSMAFSAIPNNLGLCIQSARILEFKDALRAIIASAARLEDQGRAITPPVIGIGTPVVAG
jgi:hypothetical protein